MCMKHAQLSFWKGLWHRRQVFTLMHSRMLEISLHTNFHRLVSWQFRGSFQSDEGSMLSNIRRKLKKSESPYIRVWRCDLYKLKRRSSHFFFHVIFPGNEPSCGHCFKWSVSSYFWILSKISVINPFLLFVTYRSWIDPSMMEIFCLLKQSRNVFCKKTAWKQAIFCAKV